MSSNVSRLTIVKHLNNIESINLINNKNEAVNIEDQIKWFGGSFFIYYFENEKILNQKRDLLKYFHYIAIIGEENFNLLDENNSKVFLDKENSFKNNMNVTKEFGFMRFDSDGKKEISLN